MANNILDYFLRHVENNGDATAALVKKDGKYGPVTWKEMWATAQKTARALVAAGVEPDDHVCLISSTRIEWCEQDVGIMAAGAVTVPIYPSNLDEECQYIVQNSGARLVIAEDAVQVAKFLSIKPAIENQVLKVVQFTGKKETDDAWVLDWNEFVNLGESTDDDALKARRESLSPDTILTIIYTSGTTGRPKGVVLTHSAMLYEGDVIQKIGIVRNDDVQLLFLPLAHVFAKVLEVSWFATGHQMAFAESFQTIRDNMGETRPTLMAAVPRVFEKFYGAVLENATKEEGLKKKLFLEALALSAKNGEAEERGEKLGLADSIKFAVLKRLVFAKVGERVMGILGGRMRVMVSGGAPLAKKIAWFFRDAGILICEGYGMTETSAATTINIPHQNQIGTVGPAVPGSQVRIAEDGEVLVKGPGCMREYWSNEEATAETIDEDGWLHTGDIGEIDKVTGALKITDRKKDLIITAGGKNVAPQKIENLLKTNKLISQVVVHGDRRKYLSALITLDEQVLEEWAKQNGKAGKSYADLSRDKAILDEIKKLVDEGNSELASFETIKKYEVLDVDFSIETGELTPKLSVKRKVVNSKYGHIFDGFYAEKF